MMSPFSALSPREEVIGLDVGDGLAVAACVRLDRRKRLHLKEAAWTSYNPKGSPDDIAASLRQMWRSGKLSRFSVISCLRSRALTLKRFQYPMLSEADLRSALRLEAEEALQTSQDNVVMDWHVNPPPSSPLDSELRQIDGTLVAVPRSDVDTHINLLRQARLFPVATDISCFALANLFRVCMPLDTLEGVSCLARLGTQSADVAVLYGASAIYPRTVFVHAGQAKEPTKYFAESIKDVLAYYRFKLHLADIDKVYLTGVVDDASMNTIRHAVDVPVELWEPLAQVHKMSRRLSSALTGAAPAVRAGLAIAMGLALRGE